MIKDILLIVGSFLLVIAIFWGIFNLINYRYNDCKKVGHTTFYCILDMAK